MACDLVGEAGDVGPKWLVYSARTGGLRGVWVVGAGGGVLSGWRAMVQGGRAVAEGVEVVRLAGVGGVVCMLGVPLSVSFAVDVGRSGWSGTNGGAIAMWPVGGGRGGGAVRGGSVDRVADGFERGGLAGRGEPKGDVGRG